MGKVDVGVGDFGFWQFPGAIEPCPGNLEQGENSHDGGSWQDMGPLDNGDFQY